MQQASFDRLADGLMQRYRHDVAAAPQFMSATAGPAGDTAAGRDPGLEGQVLLLGSQSSRSGLGEAEVEEFACVGIYRVCAYFYVVDALRPAVKRLPAPSKPYIPNCNSSNC